MTSDSVALIKCVFDVKKCLKEAIDIIGGFRELKSPVIVKPNICTEVDVTGFGNNNVDIVDALIQLVLDEDDELSVSARAYHPISIVFTFEHYSTVYYYLKKTLKSGIIKPYYNILGKQRSKTKI